MKRTATLTPTRSLVALALVLAAILVAIPAGQAARAGAPDNGPAADAAMKFDTDGDGLFQDLEARLHRLTADEHVDVLVELSSSATSARVNDLSSRVGGFATSKRYGIVDAYHGTIGYDGSEWGGAVFFFELPAYDPSQPILDLSVERLQLPRVRGATAAGQD